MSVGKGDDNDDFKDGGSLRDLFALSLFPTSESIKAENRKSTFPLVDNSSVIGFEKKKERISSVRGKLGFSFEVPFARLLLLCLILGSAKISN